MAAASLKGTILLAKKVSTSFWRAPPKQCYFVGTACGWTSALPTWSPRESWSDTVPFRKMLVKVKREIIRMDHPTIRPAQGVPRRWTQPRCIPLAEQGHDDAGREVVTLDTRNAFEVDAGTFADALTGALPNHGVS